MLEQKTFLFTQMVFDGISSPDYTYQVFFFSQKLKFFWICISIWNARYFKYLKYVNDLEISGTTTETNTYHASVQNLYHSEQNPNPYQWPLMTCGNWSPITGSHLLFLGGSIASFGASKPPKPLETDYWVPQLSLDSSIIWGWFVNLLASVLSSGKREQQYPLHIVVGRIS